MQGSTRQKSLAIFVAVLISSAALSGCLELKYTALNRLDDPVSIKSKREIRSVYISFPVRRPKDKPYCEYFTAALTDALEKTGFAAVDTAADADIIIKAKAVFYKKAQGTFLFVFLLPTYRFNEEYDGLAITITYKTDKGRRHKRYRAYYRGWLEGDLEIASDLVLNAIVADVLASPSAMVDKSQNKAEFSPSISPDPGIN